MNAFLDWVYYTTWGKVFMWTIIALLALGAWWDYRRGDIGFAVVTAFGALMFAILQFYPTDDEDDE